MDSGVKLSYGNLLSTIAVAANVKHWLCTFGCERISKPRAASHSGFDRKDQCRVAIANIPLRALSVMRGGRFVEAVLVGNRPIFSTPISRAPTSLRNSAFDREIECRAVRSGLAAGNNRDVLANLHSWGCVW